MSVLGAELVKTSAQRGLTPGHFGYFSASVNENAVVVGKATFSDESSSRNKSLRREVYSLDLLPNEEPGCVAIPSPAVYQNTKTFSCAYFSVTTGDVSKTLRQLFTSSFYARDTRAFRAVSCSPSLLLAASLVSDSFEASAIESDF